MESPKPVITVNLWCVAMSTVCWKCQCGQAGTATSGRHFGPKAKYGVQRTALQQAEVEVYDHLSECHPLSQLKWRTMSEDSTP